MSRVAKRKRVRTHRLEVYLADDELAMLQAVSGHRGVSVSECVRTLIANAAVSGHSPGDADIPAGFLLVQDPRARVPALEALGVGERGIKPNPFTHTWSVAEFLACFGGAPP